MVWKKIYNHTILFTLILCKIKFALQKLFTNLIKKYVTAFSCYLVTFKIVCMDQTI